MDLDDRDLETLREFVTIMRAPERNDDPVNWVSFSDVHANFCPHSNWYFTPWHRGYLRMYEVAARTLTGDQEFALPYWDWTVDRQLPRAFADETFNGRPNPLFLARDLGPNDSLPDNIVGQQEVMDGIYDETNFEAFGSTRANGQDSLDSMWIRRPGTYGQLEYTPHNNIHCIVRGPFMCSGASPQDPIFLAHHGNVDRIWEVWNSLGRENTRDPLWLDMPFTDHFIAPDGTRYTQVVGELQEVESLGYTYGLVQNDRFPDDPSRSIFLTFLFREPEFLDMSGVARFREVASMPAGPQQPLSVAVSPSVAPLRRSVETPFVRSSVVAGLREPQVYAIVRDLEPSGPDDTQLRVFVNCDYLSQAVPTSDPHYVTTIGFFDPVGHGEQRPSALVNLTPALRRLGRAQRFDPDQVVVQLLPTQQYGRTLADAGSVAVREVEVVIV